MGSPHPSRAMESSFLDAGQRSLPVHALGDEADPVALLDRVEDQAVLDAEVVGLAVLIHAETLNRAMLEPDRAGGLIDFDDLPLGQPLLRPRDLQQAQCRHESGNRRDRFERDHGSLQNCPRSIALGRKANAPSRRPFLLTLRGSPGGLVSGERDCFRLNWTPRSATSQLWAFAALGTSPYPMGEDRIITS